LTGALTAFPGSLCFYALIFPAFAASSIEAVKHVFMRLFNAFVYYVRIVELFNLFRIY